jgi:hypothetical protein
MLGTGQCLVVPPGISGGTPIVISLEEILIAERRQDEVATVNSARAPELLAEFTRQWLNLSRIVSLITAERNKAEKALNSRRSIILVDLMTEKLKEKGLTSSADNREAIITLDEEYIKLGDILDQISAILELMKGKMKSFDMAFTSVKRLIVADTYMQYNKNNSLSGDTYSTSKVQIKPPRAGFGNARS